MVANKSLAEYNLSQEPHLTAKKTKLTEKHREAIELVSAVKEAKSKLESKTGKIQPDSLYYLLEVQVYFKLKMTHNSQICLFRWMRLKLSQKVMKLSISTWTRRLKILMTSLNSFFHYAKRCTWDASKWTKWKKSSRILLKSRHQHAKLQNLLQLPLTILLLGVHHLHKLPIYPIYPTQSNPMLAYLTPITINLEVKNSCITKDYGAFFYMISVFVF